MSKPTVKKPYSKMTPKDLDRGAREFENVRFEDTAPLTPEEQAQWDAAKRPGRRRVGAGAVRVLISIERNLLSRLDTAARRQNIARSELIARALRRELMGAGVIASTVPANPKVAKTPTWAEFEEALAFIAQNLRAQYEAWQAWALSASRVYPRPDRSSRKPTRQRIEHGH